MKYELTRVNIFLPKKQTTLLALYQLVVQLYRDFGGCTHSSVDPPFFIGYWLKPLDPQPKKDEIVWFIVDVDQRLDDPRLEYFSFLKKSLEEKTGEEEVWIVCQQVWRFIEAIQ
jgi:hypothetical protein